MPKPREHGPLLLAHRGACAYERENTIEAFRAASALGADGVELDVRATSDRALVVHHDPGVEGVGAIADATLSDLRRGAPYVPTLDAALAACTGVVNVEIKNSPREPGYDPNDRLARAVAQLLVQLIADGSPLELLVSSFNPRTIASFREVAPDLSTGWLIMPGVDPRDALAFVATEGHQALHPSVWGLPGLDPGHGADPGHAADPDHAEDPGHGGSELDELVAIAHGQGIALNVWTVDDPAVMRRLARAGVDALITNVPDVAVATLRTNAHDEHPNAR